VVAIFGSTEPSLTGPVGTTEPPHRILRRKVECSPCYLRECPIDFRCMKEITVEMVATAVKESLQSIQRLTEMKETKRTDQPADTIIP
jgi:heptosyltransferase-2